MARQARAAPGGFVYHVLNRAVARLPLFRKDADYAAFEQLLCQAQARQPTRILAWCLMPNHWHFVSYHLNPATDYHFKSSHFEEHAPDRVGWPAGWLEDLARWRGTGTQLVS